MYLLVKADARHIPLRDETVQCVVTSPPYWKLRDFELDAKGIGLESSLEEYVAGIVEVFYEVWRVLRKNGTVWLNLGDRFQKKQLMGVPWKVVFALQANGWYLRSDIIWAKPNPTPESVSDRPMKSHEYVFLLSKSKKYWYNQDAVREPQVDPLARGGDSWGSRLGGKNEVAVKGRKREYNPNGRILRTVWTIATQPFPGAHFATFPEVLAERCIKAGSKVGDVVLDPFGGSGTTALVAIALGRMCIHMDLKYHELALKDRITNLEKYFERKKRRDAKEMKNAYYNQRSNL